MHAVLSMTADEKCVLEAVEKLHALGIHIVDQQRTDEGEAPGIQRLRRVVMQVRAKLTDRERRLMQKRFGIDSNNSGSLEDIERDCSVTVERIRAAEAKALRNLSRRKPPDDEDP